MVSGPDIDPIMRSRATQSSLAGSQSKTRIATHPSKSDKVLKALQEEPLSKAVAQIDTEGSCTFGSRIKDAVYDAFTGETIQKALQVAMADTLTQSSVIDALVDALKDQESHNHHMNACITLVTERIALRVQRERIIVHNQHTTERVDRGRCCTTRIAQWPYGAEDHCARRARARAERTHRTRT